jgi:hypothetical protein
MFCNNSRGRIIKMLAIYAEKVMYAIRYSNVKKTNKTLLVLTLLNIFNSYIKPLK